LTWTKEVISCVRYCRIVTLTGTSAKTLTDIETKLFVLSIAPMYDPLIGNAMYVLLKRDN